jgi:hypothetical protein
MPYPYQSQAGLHPDVGTSIQFEQFTNRIAVVHVGVLLLLFRAGVVLELYAFTRKLCVWYIIDRSPRVSVSAHTGSFNSFGWTALP